MSRIKYSKKSQRIVLKKLSNFFSSRLVVLEYCIDDLGKNHIPLQCDFLIIEHKKYNFGQNLSQKF